MALVEAEVEGVIDTPPAALAGGGAAFTVMGIPIRFVPGVTATGRTRTISTPQVVLTVPQFLSLLPFPGRAQPGFLGATAIAEGFFDTDTGALLADFLAVEPAETVVLGALTRNFAGPPRDLRVNGMPIAMLTDTRLPANPDDPANPVFLNQYGFPMQIDTAVQSPLGPTPNPPPAPSSVEGYFAQPGVGPAVFHAFLFEYGDTGALLVDPAVTPQLSMGRASYRDRGAEVEYEARGFVTASHPGAGALSQNVEVFRVDLNPATGAFVETLIDRADIDPVEPGYERWRLNARVAKPGGFLAGVPLFIRAKNQTGIVPATGLPAQAQQAPDAREA